MTVRFLCVRSHVQSGKCDAMNKGCDIRHLSERSKVRPLGAFLLLLGVLAFAPSTVLAANSGHFSEGQLIAARPPSHDLDPRPRAGDDRVDIRSIPRLML